MSATKEEYNCLHVYNNSKKTVTVFIYEGFSPLCKFSSVSKILEPEQNCSTYIIETFKFEIFEIKENKTKQKHLGPEECCGIKIITVSDEKNSLKCQTITVNDKEKKRIVQLMKGENDLPSGDLYELLELDMRKVRKMDKDQRKEAIQNAYLKMIRIWHPDKPNGDNEKADQLFKARDILLNDELRAQYHNQIDFEQGFFSLRRWKAIFFPEMANDDSWINFFKRLGCVSLFSIMAVGGVATTILTGGLATPVLVILGAMVGQALTVAGLECLLETLSKESAVHGIDRKKLVIKAFIGGLAGALSGGASGFFTTAMIGTGSAVSIGQKLSMEAASGAIGGAILSPISNFAKKILLNEKITFGQFLRDILKDTLLCATFGIAGVGLGEALSEIGFLEVNPTLEGGALE